MLLHCTSWPLVGTHCACESLERERGLRRSGRLPAWLATSVQLAARSHVEYGRLCMPPVR
jgi:chloramphenicol 3-O-phosphotransferase